MGLCFHFLFFLTDVFLSSCGETAVFKTFNLFSHWRQIAIKRLFPPPSFAIRLRHICRSIARPPETRDKPCIDAAAGRNLWQRSTDHLIASTRRLLLQLLRRENYREARITPPHSCATGTRRALQHLRFTLPLSFISANFTNVSF